LDAAQSVAATTWIGTDEKETAVYKRRQHRIEKLETRELMAGDVTANVVNGDLYLSEASGQAGLDNAVWISKLANGNIRVDGNPAPDFTRTRVNGQSFQEFTVTGKLYVDFGGGQDLVGFDATSKPVFQEVHINVGASSAVGNSDDDDVLIYGVVSRGDVEIDTGAGDDWVFVSRAEIGTVADHADLEINTGAGSDEVNMGTFGTNLQGGIDIRTYSSLNETDADYVYVENITLTDDLRIRSGGGDDKVQLTTVSADDDIDINTGTGNDRAYLDHVTAVDDLMAHLGDGNDRLDVYNSSANEFVAAGEGGSDSIWTRPASGLPRFTNTFGSTTQTDFEWVNGLRPGFSEPLPRTPFKPQLGMRL
jgi:hypothetical protein